MVLFFTHIPFVGNHAINATPPERLHHYLSFSHSASHDSVEFFVQPSLRLDNRFSKYRGFFVIS